MNNPTFNVTLPYRVYCNLPDCGKPVNHVFRKNIEGNMCNFCCIQHANLGEERWQEKKEKNIRMNVPPPPDNEEYTGGNVPENGGDE